MTPAGLEPAIPGSVGRCLIHWATGPLAIMSYLRRLKIYTCCKYFERMFLLEVADYYALTVSKLRVRSCSGFPKLGGGFLFSHLGFPKGDTRR